MYDYTQILERLIDIVPDNFDKRQGSIVYNALAPVAAELAQFYINLEIFTDQTYLLTAAGESLDMRAMDHSILRREATPAYRLAMTYNSNNELFNVPLGTRYAVPNMEQEITFLLDSYIETGLCILICEQPGVIGNDFIGDLLPIVSVNNLGRIEVVGQHRPGQDAEDDDEFRQRVLDRLGQKAFGGNIADYKEFVTDIDGVGQVKVFPAWQGGGTVLLSVIDSDFQPIGQTFLDELKTIIDPVEYTGEGVGIAPIGHKVTIVTPAPLKINIEATVTIEFVTAGQILPEIESNINDYLADVKTQWHNSTTTSVFLSRINEAILRATGVINVTGTLLNGMQQDISITDTSALQQVPVLGTVVLREL